ncbi:hypothetical protein A9Q84_04455 [Halobacteriovorax marinus]|uniref:Secreted protein n=1 Tax=Halobacteriovorax marinus TaxID=97084 RepID=A0A1Y5FAN1_9BACT|nr:hypothetical protein A9Q84_04455 [Halobacteriovorax marinus]
MKFSNILLAGAITLASVTAQGAAVQGQTGKFCPGAQVVKKLDGAYVERMFIAAEGIRTSGFIHVFADGVKVQRIGVPGYDPDYTFRIRRNVQEIRLTFEGTCSRILGHQIFTATSDAPDSYRAYDPNNVRNGSWGSEVLALVGSLEAKMVNDNLQVNPLYTKVLKRLKKVALFENASETVRHQRSLVKTLRALKMAKIIRNNQNLLIDSLMNGYDDHVVMDLLEIKEDILEHTDVKEKNLKSTIKELEEILN